MRPQAGTAGSLHAGLVLADDQYEQAATRHLQSRLTILYGVMAAAAIGFYLIEQIVPIFERNWKSENITKTGALVHLSFIVLVSFIFRQLRSGPLVRSRLHTLDAAALYLGAGTALAVYALLFDEGPRDIVAMIALFIVARAVVVPSSPRVTFFLSLLLPVTLLVIDLVKAPPFNYDGSVMTKADDIASVPVWNQVVIFFGIGVATVASRLNSALRARLDAAHRIGQYRLEEKIGEGAVGEVYLATHALLRRPTAIKLLRPEILGEETIARFDEEVRLASRLSHPNTIRIFDYGRTPEGVLYYAMEHVRGQDLAHIVDRYGPMPAERVIYALEQVCRSLAEAHDLGLVHRDIKPGNIMLCTKGGEYDVVKLVDFGLAKDLRHASAIVEVSGTVCGTPETIAPEVLRGVPPSASCDLYALGAVGVFLLTGSPIFDATAPLAFLRAHLEEEPISPSERGVSVPPELEALLLRCLSKDPSERPASAALLGQALRDLDGMPRWTHKSAAAWWTRSDPAADMSRSRTECAECPDA